MRNYNDVTQFGWYGLATESAAPAGGDVYYVDGNSGNAANTATSGQGDSWSLPFANIKYAVSRCSNDAGNIIFVAADHTETLTATGTASGTTTTQLVVDKSGVTIIGLGTSDRRPTITVGTATTAEVLITASECTLKNLLFVSGLADLETLIEADGNAAGLRIEDCEFRDGSATLEAIDSVSLAADVDDVVIRGCRFITTDTGSSTQSAIAMAGGSDRLVVQDNYFYGDWGGGGYAVIEGGTAASTGILIDNNHIYNLDATKGEGITMHANTTGFITNNVIYSTNAASSPLQAAKCVKAGNKITSVLLVEGQPQGGAGAIANGNHFYVDSGTGVDTATGLSWHDPLATVDAAIGKCTNAYGDTIHVAAGHAEDITGSTTYIFDLDKSGVTIIGYGQGAQRPTFTFKTSVADANVYVTGADCRITNCIFTTNLNSMHHMIDVNADDFQVDNCLFNENSATALSCITCDATDAVGDGLKILNNRFYTPTAGNQDNAIEIGKDLARVQIIGNYIMGDFDEAAIEIPAGGNASQDMVITDNIIINEQTGIHCVEIDIAALTVTGLFARNTLICDTRSAAAQTNIMSRHDNVWIDLGGNLAPVKLDEQSVTPGNHVYVDSNLGADNTAQGGSWEEPVATLDYAIGLCANNNGDTIHVAPGHAETIATPSGLDFDVIGVTVIGYGNGTDRPTITLDTGTDTTVVVDAANVTIENVIFINTQDALVVGFDVNAAHFTMRKCVFRDAGADNTLEWIIADANADYMTIEDCVNEGTDTAGNTAWITLNGATYTTIKGCTSNGDFSAANIRVVTAACTDLLIANNHLQNNNAVDVNIELFAACTGWVSKNMCHNATDAQTTWINTPGNTSLFENYGVNNNGETGMIIGTASQ
jgi:hypothetical protein